MSADPWTQKVAAYLAWPPSRALDPSGAEARAERLIEAALSERVDVPHAAARQAAGLDVPFDLAGRAKGSGNPFADVPTVVHPLSGAAHSLDLGSGDAKGVFDATRAAVEQLREQARGADGSASGAEAVFLSLWRYLPEAVKTSGALPERTWDVLPADPHFPSLPVWSHASAASALAGAGERPALLLFTLGSPQTFVTTARRTQDYWMGSFLISYLMWKGMQPLAERYGPDAFLYPNLHGQPLVDHWLATRGVGTFDVKAHQEALQIANFPNVFTALVPDGRADDAAKEAEEAIRCAWDAVGRSVKAAVEHSAEEALGVKDLHADPMWSDGWCRQLGGFPDRLGVFWSVCPWGAPRQVMAAAFPEAPAEEVCNEPGIVPHVRALLDWTEEDQEQPLHDGMGYALFSNLAAPMLASRKALRDFPKTQEPGWKCSLCGEREALHPGEKALRARYGNRRMAVLLRRFWSDLAGIGQHERSGYQKLAGRIRSGDRLCAVCLTKRLALETRFGDEFRFDHLLFPSTATLATVPFKAALLRALRDGGDLAEAVTGYTKATWAFVEEAGADYFSAGVPKLNALAEAVDAATGEETADRLLRLDGEWLYEKAFDPDKLRREYEIDVDSRPDLERLRLKALGALRALLDAARTHGAPSRYYAIVSMDGDKMGDHVGGKRAPFYEWMLHPQIDADALDLPDRDADHAGILKRPLGPGTHLATSSALKDFALRLARFAVEDVHSGKLLFAGGDDVLALVPVADLLSVMRLLRALFQGRGDGAEPLEETAGGKTVRVKDGFGEVSTLDGAAERFFLTGAPHVRRLRTKPEPEFFEGPTASIGVAVVHESAPLVPAIEEAVEAMKASAKEGAGRDAFAVHLLKRSGSPLSMASKFFPGASSSGTPPDVLALVEKLVGYLRERRFSPSIARDLLARPLSGEDATRTDLKNWLWEARRAELHRLIRRRTRDAGDDGPARTLDTLLQALHVAEENYLNDSTRESAPVGTTWTTLAHLILLARFLASETAHAD